MKICIVVTHPSQFDTPVFRLGNDFIHVVFTDNKLCSANFDPELQRNVSWETDIFAGYSYEILNQKNSFFQLYKILYKNKYDLILTSGYFNAHYIFSLILSCFFSKSNGLRLDSVSYNDIGIKRLLKLVFYRVIDFFVDYYFVVGSLSKNFLIGKGILNKKIKFFGYIPNKKYFNTEGSNKSTEVSILHNKYGIPQNKKCFLCVSKHIEREAPFDTLRAFAKLSDSETHLIIIGDGILNTKLKILAEDLNILNISFVGYISFQLLPEFYSISSVFIHDSRDEPWGVSVQEALMSGLPVIVSDRVGAGYDLVKAEENGYVYTSGDVDDLVVKMQKTLLLRKSNVLIANDEVLKDWTYESIINGLRSITPSC